MTDGPLAMNPFVDIHLHPPPEAYPIDVTRIETITVRCPVRGRGLVIREITPSGDPALFAFFAALVAQGGELALESDAPLVPELARIGLLVTDDEIVDWPRFEVPLEPAADAGLAPDPAAASAAASAAGSAAASAAASDAGSAAASNAGSDAASNAASDVASAAASDAASDAGSDAASAAASDAASDVASDAGWIVSPTFRFQPAFALHPDVRWPADYDEQDGRLACFAPGPAFWIGDPAAFVAPFWVAP
ncbi:MAG TPA: hypothetical protein VGD37_01500, partial [Kofleriaceae bacterium]